MKVKLLKFLHRNVIIFLIFVIIQYICIMKCYPSPNMSLFFNEKLAIHEFFDFS